MYQNLVNYDKGYKFWYDNSAYPVACWKPRWWWNGPRHISLLQKSTSLHHAVQDTSHQTSKRAFVLPIQPPKPLFRQKSVTSLVSLLNLIHSLNANLDTYRQGNFGNWQMNYQTHLTDMPLCMGILIHCKLPFSSQAWNQNTNRTGQKKASCDIIHWWHIYITKISIF